MFKPLRKLARSLRAPTVQEREMAYLNEANDAIELSRTDGRDEFTHYNRQLFVSDCALLLPLLEDRLELAVLTLKLAGRSLDKKRLQQQEGDVSSDCSSA